MRTRIFHLSDAQLAQLPTVEKGHPPDDATQQRADLVWQQLGRTLGFDWTTVEPLPERGPAYFRACAARRGEPA